MTKLQAIAIDDPVRDSYDIDHVGVLYLKKGQFDFHALDFLF